jgi:mitogen-activated protein kinase kinase
MEKNNRKSHLAPMLSPATQELLRGGDDSPTGDYQDMSQTPTSGDIPIGGTDIRATVISPREQIINTINSARTPKANGSIARAGAAGASSNATFSHTLPMRPAPPGGPLPPPPVPRKENSEGRRQAAFGNGY